MPPQVFYFDMGNVLLEFCHDRMCRQMAEVAGVSSEVVNEALLGTSGPREVQWLYESGELDSDAYYEYFCERIGTRPDREKLAYACSDIFEPIESSAKLVYRLAGAGHRLAVLSNTNKLHWDFVTDGRYPVLSRIGEPGSPFAWAVLSYEAGSMKPDARIYEVAIERAGVPAKEVFFTDDRPENVEGAIELGIDAVVFTSAEQLAADLRERGVL